MSSSPFASLTNDMVIDTPAPAHNLGNSPSLSDVRDRPLEGEAIVAVEGMEAEDVIPHLHSPGSSVLRPKLRNWPSERRPTPLMSYYAPSVDSGTLTLIPRAPTTCLWTIVVSNVPQTTPVEGTPGPQSVDLPGLHLMLPTMSPPSHNSTGVQTHPAPPRTMAQVISAACTDTAVSTPFTSAPTSPDAAIDHSSDVAELIAEAKQMDLEAEARCAGFSSTEEMFAAMNIQTAQAAQP
ncbi:hypothetical protein DFJ58DRAFT_727380 [Suillus subalutaceus]|uniref:uncharacterized protein n=1 Tax=Suillus subalutaceus TaxID=48586 RepID=UPI001B8817E4|nr:uncharacterized protein DFJ58DRAFT_727380 [Suillus subalutaceus]KAG1855724.1 hypothetical protein DFJ58DRAFT_727380 [Suillus subalutaceus]